MLPFAVKTYTVLLYISLVYSMMILGGSQKINILQTPTRKIGRHDGIPGEGASLREFWWGRKHARKTSTGPKAQRFDSEYLGMFSSSVGKANAAKKTSIKIMESSNQTTRDESLNLALRYTNVSSPCDPSHGWTYFFCQLKHFGHAYLNRMLTACFAHNHVKKGIQSIVDILTSCIIARPIRTTKWPEPTSRYTELLQKGTWTKHN